MNQAARVEFPWLRSGSPCTEMMHAGAGMLVLIGSHDEALRCLEEAVASHSLNISAVLRDSIWFDPLRDDPRFQAMLEGMGLAD